MIQGEVLRFLGTMIVSVLIVWALIKIQWKY